MHASFTREIWRRVTAKKELTEKVRLQALEEAKEINVLKHQKTINEQKLEQL